MIPILYPSNETAFTNNGLGALSDAISCIVTEERNGMFELEMEYPIHGRHYEDISEEKIIYAIPADREDPQPFDIYKITTPIDGIITIYARHISYRLAFIPVSPFEQPVVGVSYAVEAIKSHSVENNPFSIDTNISNDINSYNLTVPASFRECLGGKKDSIIGIFGGEVKWDKFEVHLLANRGRNRGVKITYSKNLTELKHEADTSNMITGVYPYWSKATSDGAVTTVSGDVVYPDDPVYHVYNRTIVLDLSSKFSDKPSKETLNQEAKNYINKKRKDVADTNLTVSFIPLWQTEEYKNIAPLQEVQLCDTVTVEHPEINVSVTKKVIKTEYDVLAERYTKIELGENLSSSIDKTIVDYNTNMDSEMSKAVSFIEEALRLQTEKINGGLGGYVIIKDGANGYPDEIIIGNTPDKESMTKCIRINKNGIGFSEGYYEEMKTAWTIDGEFDGQQIKAGSIKADSLEAGLLKIGALSDGYIEIQDGLLIIGNKNSPIKIKQTNDKVSFVDSTDSDLASIQYNRFYAPNIDVGAYRISDTDGLLFSFIGEVKQ